MPLLCALLAAAALAGAAAAQAGTLAKADVEAMFAPPLLVGDKLAHLPAWPVYMRTGQGPVLQHHVFETVDLEPVAGYGGKPLNLLVVTDRDGAFEQVHLLSHMEPIFRSEQGTRVLAEFGQQYQGLTVNHQIQVLGAKAERVVTPTTATLHGIVAGTVTATAIDRSILESAAQVAQAHLNPAARAQEAPHGPDDRYQRTGFNGLVAARLVQPWSIEHRSLQAAFAGTEAANRDAEAVIRPQVAGVDLWLAFVGLPQAGRNLLEPARWRQVREARERGQTVLLVLDGGRYPLADPLAAQGRRLQRGATLALRQHGREFPLAVLDWDKGLRISGTHSGVAAGSSTRYFVVRPAADGSRFDPFQPVQMTLGIWRRSGEGPQEVVLQRREREFEIPEVAAYTPQREVPRWLQAWAGRGWDLAIAAIGLALLTVALVAQRRTAASQRRLLAFRTAYLVFTLVFIGWWAQGQLTIVSLTSGLEAAVAGRSLEFLLADPMAVLLWGYTLVTLLAWGRGTFCGWLCPFGALQELVARIAGLAGIAQRRLRLATDRMLKGLKYAVLAALAGVSLVSAAWTEALVEVEPFKTSISLYFQRDWPYVLWAALCLAAGVLVYRGYCRYLCPLGALLALGGRARLRRWIPRRAQCGTPCQTCRHRCGYQAISVQGRVDYAECFQCLDCVQLHDDSRHCLPLVAAARGKTIPIRVVAAPLQGAAP